MPQTMEELYPQLYPKAMEIVSGAVKGCNVIRWREIAHDLTVDFLFFSKSFNETYDASLGMVKPFFASYVRKRCMGVRERMQVELNRTRDLSRNLDSGSDHVKVFELIDELKSNLSFLESQYYRSINKKSYCLADVYSACIESTLKYGSINLTFMRGYLHVDLQKLRGMLAKMRRILKERECQNRTRF